MNLYIIKQKQLRENLTKKNGEYHDLYVIIIIICYVKILSLSDLFTNFRDKCIDVYKLDSASFYFTRININSKKI